MAVAKEQIGEIKAIFDKWITSFQQNLLFEELRKTEAYKTNQSFRETIELLAQSE